MTASTAWLQQAVLDALTAEADQHAPFETGGLILGHRHSPSEIVITDAIGPGPSADHRRTGFDPDTTWQTAELARRYEQADRRLHYLGDWHTHPGGTTTLSRTDRRTLRAIARYPHARCEYPVMAVLADGNPWTLAIRQSTYRLLRPDRLNRLAIRMYE